MPALNITFTEEEMAALRRQAARENVSLKTLVHDAVLAETHRRRVTAAAVRTARISAGLNERLATK
ncbi:hypothetical protein SAMN06297387_102248 [Streptomyces zhaozhouensis]|uniref:Ribbon-helix-helix protein, copG family n=1 Tax=Streptomyces zhaozhouensis TaxID=1300267 RepID=A0A286DQ21_9ACTN|nr:hypothetical protein [Streptomyces zhaozhouensis]SOD60749.1 hypothetical protein SAMN06297387_102248 [Streptomyces zhaozhouensis]